MQTRIIITQMQMFATMLFFGFAMYRTKMISDESIKGFYQVLTKFIIPCMLISMMPNGGSINEVKSSGTFIMVSFAYIACMLIISFIISNLVFKDKKRRNMNTIDCSMGNAGFIGSPLCAAIYPSQAVVNAIYVIVEALYCWIIGPFIADENMEFKPENLKNLKTPIMAAIMLGLIMTLLDIHPSGFVPWDAITSIGQMTKYLAAFYIGLSLGQIGFKSLIADKRIFITSLMKLIVFPLAAFFVVNTFHILSGDRLGTFMIMASTPTGMAMPMVAELGHGDKEYAVAGTMINTILCLVTIPVVSMLTM